jgi:hypothetical protein
MWVSAIRLEIVPQELPPDKTMSRKKRNAGAIILAASLKSKDGKESKLPFYFGDADHKHERYVNGHALLGVTDQWQVSTEDDHQSAVWLLAKPLKAAEGDKLVLNLGNAAVTSARVSVTPFPSGDVLQAGIGEPLRQALEAPAQRRVAADRQLLNRTFLLTTQWDAEALAADRKLQADIRECRHGRAFTMVSMSRGEPTVTRVLARGNWQDESGEIVQPAAPHFLPQIPNPDNHRLTRLDLARWLVSPENPLTARAVVNRLWKQFFGAGISLVVDDLGGQGEWPVQPELLDWLACEFMKPIENGKTNPPRAWDVKHMVKLMVMSATYRQDSNARPDLKEIDPNNRLLACQSPRRLEAEFVRDNALFIAGLLNEDIGGPGAHPYQPPGYYSNLQFPDRDYHADQDDRQYRRGVYAHWQRTFLQPMLANFDAPGREECLANRNVSNTPQQALTLLNDPTFVEAARVFAQKTLAAKCPSDGDRINWAFQHALARDAKDKEKQSLLKFLAEQRAHCRDNPDEDAKLLHVGIAPAPTGADSAEAAAWTQLCRVILNLHESITKY